jgi:hypothetical protein
MLIGGSVTTNESNYDPAVALGFRNDDNVLVIGNPGFMPWIFNSCSNITPAKKLNDLKALVQKGAQFDKIVIARETSFVHEMISYAGPLLRKSVSGLGLLIVFQSDDGWTTKEASNFYYPDARSWEIDTTYGRALVVEACGTSWRFYA